MGEGGFLGMFFNLRDGKGWGTVNLTSATIPHGTPLVVLDGESMESNLTRGYQASFSTFGTCRPAIYKVCTKKPFSLGLRNVIKGF